MDPFLLFVAIMLALAGCFLLWFPGELNRMNDRAAGLAFPKLRSSVKASNRMVRIFAIGAFIGAVIIGALAVVAPTWQ